MVLATEEENRQLGLTNPPPGIPEIKPERKVRQLAKVDHKTFRQLMPLSEDQMIRVKKVMKNVVQEWKTNTRLQNNKLRRAIERLEGVSAPKDYPWPDASNLNIPYAEIQILIASDIVSSTMMDAEPAFFVREMLPARKDFPEEQVDPKIEWWLNWVFKKQLNLEDEVRMAVMLAFRDPLSILVLDWAEDLPIEYSIEIFRTVDELQARFKDAEDAGVPQDIYDRWLGQLSIGGEPIALEIKERVVRYRGPKSRVVELKDFIRSPVSSPNVEYLMFCGDQFRQRKDYFRSKAAVDWFYKDEVKALLEKTAKNKAKDDIDQRLDVIEGISSSERADPDEYDCVRGNLKIDLDNDGEEEMYHVVYNHDNNILLRMERYPYWHNRSNYIPYRIRRKPNRLLGRCFMDMLYDIGEEINTQHNQRIDSRTITTVPTFKIQANETDLIQRMERKDQWFYPGTRFILQNMNNLQQLETKVDFSGTLQEEQNLFQIGDMLTGTASGGARSGRPDPKDPRSSGKKMQALLGQSNQRIDGYIRDLKPSINETAAQVVELYFQFSPDDAIQYQTYDESTELWVRAEIKRNQLRNRNMTIEVARTSVLDNPDAILQRALTDYEIWSKEPMIGGNIQRRWELIRSTLFAERNKNIPKLLPPLKQLLAEMQQQDQLQGGSDSQQNLLNSVQEKTGKPKREEPTGKRQGSKDLRPSQLDRSQKGQ